MINLQIECTRPGAAALDAPSQRVLETAAMFGLGVDESQQMTIIPPCEIPLPTGVVVFITGPSGGGKSTILRLIAQQAAEQGLRVINLADLPPLPEAPLVDALGDDLAEATNLLSLAGLGDAFVMLRRPGELSDGQRWRLRVAQAIQLASTSENAAIILADEFGATLDRVTAMVIARNISRWTRSSRHTFIAATTHDDLLEALDPDVLIEKGLGDAIVVKCRERQAAALRIDENRDRLIDELRVEPGTLADYKSLAGFHYKGGRPGAVTSVFRIVHRASSVVGRWLGRREEAQIASVLVRSLSHLSCQSRDLATGGRYRGLSRKQSAAALNREVRTISRVVVDPRWRGAGLAVRLVRHALANPEAGVIFTEALAAMGRVHPFFEKAGMTRYDRPPRAEHARLIDALEHVGLNAASLSSLTLMRRALDMQCEAERTFVERELCRWHAAAGGRGGKERELTLDELLLAARQGLLAEPVYYLFRHS